MSEKLHAKYSPSSRYRWSKCSKSVGLHVSTPNEATEEGTRAHEVFEHSLLTLTDYKKDDWRERLGELNYSFIQYPENYPPEMRTHAVNCIRNTLEYLDILSIEDIENIGIEKTLGTPGALNFGTGDWCFDYSCSDKFLRRVILDYKYGMRPVSPDENPQLLNYAALDYMTNPVEADEYILAIYQPRVDGFKYVRYPANRVEFELKVLKKELEAAEDRPKFQAGSHCTFCSHKPDCQEYQRTSKELALSVFNTNDNTPKEELPLELCAEIITKEKQLKDFISYCKDKVFTAMINHQDVKGWKLIQGSGNRKWTDDQIAAQRLASLGVTPYEQKVVSPTSVEKTDKTVYSQMEDLVVRPEGKLRLVPESHKGKAIESPLEVFDFNKG